MTAETLPFALVAAQALHRQHVAHAFLDIPGGHRPGRPARLAATAHGAWKRQHGQELQRQDADGEPDDFGGLSIVERHHHNHQRAREYGANRRHDGLEKDVGKRRGVIHDPIQAVADFLVVQERQRQRLNALEQL